MKKILFFAGLLAFVTSCTDDELISSGSYNQELPNGISFNGSVADVAESRGMLTYDEAAQNFPFFWYAEQDKINVYAFGEVEKMDGTATQTPANSWAKLQNPQSVIYKATQSKANGQFTAKDETNLIQFADTTASNKKLAEATFAATYNATVAEVSFDKNKAIDTISIKPTVALNTQDYATNNVTAYLPMYSVSQATQAEEYNSVGESVGLKFYRYGNIIGFQSTGIDATYKSLFGKLDSIYVETLGNEKDTIAASALAWDATTPTYKIVVGAPVDFKKSSIVMAEDDSVSIVKAAYKSAWGDGDIAYVATMPVVRNNKTEYYKVTYKFENITFVKDSLTTTSDWASATNGVRSLSQANLKMADYSSLVVGNEADSKSLLVNSGDFDAIFKDSTLLKWNGGTDVTSIDTLICKVALTEAQTKRLAKFTNLKYIQLDEATVIAKGALNAAGLKYINMPKVTTIAEGFSTAGMTPETVLLPAYAYNNLAVNNALIKTGLKKIDITGVTKVEETFYTPNVLTFQGITSLEEVKLNNLKVEVPNFFAGCTNLKKVDGVIDITNAPKVFSNVDSLTTVYITGTVIPEAAFYNADLGVAGAKHYLSSVKVVASNDTVDLVPTTVGNNAFYGCTALTTMDLKNTTTIGDYAFFGTGLAKATANATTSLMTVGATTIGEKALGATGLTQVDFVNATSIGNAILISSPTTAVQFQKPFTVDETRTTAWDADQFGSASTLYVANGQKYVEGNKLMLPWVNGENTAYTAINFVTIRVAAAQ